LAVTRLHGPLADLAEGLAAVRSPAGPAKLQVDRLHDTALMQPDVDDTVTVAGAKHASRKRHDLPEAERRLAVRRHSVGKTPAHCELLHAQGSGIPGPERHHSGRLWRGGR